MARKAPAEDVTDLVQSLGLLIRRLRSLDAARELAWPEAIVLKRLAQDGPATAAALAREAGVRPQSMGGTLAALAKRGLLERSPHPRDRRQVLLGLSVRGAALRQSVGDAKRSWLAAAVGRLDPRDQATLFAASSILKRLAAS